MTVDLEEISALTIVRPNRRRRWNERRSIRERATNGVSTYSPNIGRGRLDRLIAVTDMVSRDGESAMSV